ncbi:MAG: hypothetical protein MJE77_42385 [Proteobacteria bacterium]|nr:hypothetical protein [Pseudomonadota bacterium]
MLGLRAAIATAALAFLLAACAPASGVGTLRFRNQPIVWQINDRMDVPKKPEERKYARTLYHVDGFVVRRLTRKMEFREPSRAANINAVDEVPDSTWFHNRIGMRELSVEEVRRGPNMDEGPENYKPWTITSSKVGGTAVGFIMEDGRGIKYLLKFDDKKGPEVETAADVIVQRILWAAGYNVPEDSIVYFRREDLVLAADASKKDVFGTKTPMTVSDLEESLAEVDVLPDGSYRGLASKYLSGIPIGPYAREGVRKDDPNDRIPHELRRELRGQYPIFAWLNHTDLQEDNTLDMWAEDPRDPKKHYVMHYLVDFGKALGVMGYFNHWTWIGYAHRVDFSFMSRSFLTLGLWKRPWEDISTPPIRGLGLYEVDSYEPGSWKANSPYWPLKDKDRFDAFWGAKILIRFTPEHLRAVVTEAKYSDPRAAEYMVRALIARQRKTARYWFQQVNPLDRFEVKAEQNGHSLCFDDLMVQYELDDIAAIVTEYRGEAFDYAGQPTGWSARAKPGQRGRTCLKGIVPAANRDGYTIVLIVTQRGGRDLPATLVHLAKTPNAETLRIIGLRRQ